MDKEELIGKLQMVYVGDRNALNELIGYYDGLKQVTEELQQENKILRENAENNDKVVDNVNWENMLLKKENEKLKENWNKLKEYIEKDYGFYDKLIAPEYGCAMGALRRIKDEMQELEQGSDNNVKDYNVKD